MGVMEVFEKHLFHFESLKTKKIILLILPSVTRWFDYFLSFTTMKVSQ